MVEKLFWVLCGIVAYIYFGYPLVLFLLSLIWGKRPETADITPPVTLIIAAYNEQKVIKEKIENSLALEYPSDRLEIVVASESTDQTNEIVQQYASKGVVLRAFSTREGKAATLFRCVPFAKGEIIVFSDANAMYQPDAIRKLVRNFNDRRIGCVSGRLVYINPMQSSIGSGESLYWRYEIAIKRLESKLFSLLGANGSIFAIRRSLYLPIDRQRGDDFELAIRVLLAGFGVVYEAEAVSIEPTSASISQEFRRKVRIISWMVESGLILLREALKRRNVMIIFQLLSHKISRWFVPFLLISILIINIVLKSSLYLIFLVLQSAFYVSAFVGYFLDRSGIRCPKLLIVPYFFCVANAACLMGVLRFLLRRRIVVWEPFRD